MERTRAELLTMGTATPHADSARPGANGHASKGDQPFVQFNTTEPSARDGAQPITGGAPHVRLSIGGKLSTEYLTKIWNDALVAMRKARSSHVEVDVSRLTCTDTACLALFAEIRKVAAETGGKVNFVEMKPELKELLDLATLEDPRAPELRPPARLGIVQRAGEITVHALHGLRAMVSFLGELCAGFAWIWFHPRQVRWRDFLNSCEKAGADALPVILLVGFLIGVMLAFQSAGQTERYGVRTVIPSVVAIAVTRELGPLLTTILIAGRTGSAYAAELGSMKADQELNALKVMGLDPVRFLAVPRVLAVVLMAPLLTAFFDLAGITGGYTVMATHDFSFTRYIVQAYQSLNWSDVFGGIGKTVVFAAIIGGVGCMRGIQAGMESRAVGQSTTRAVVTAIVLIIAADGCFGVIYYYFGI